MGNLGVLGVLGGMGPLATADFLTKLVEITPAKKDADHLPVIIRSIPQIPDRTAALLEAGPSPLPELVEHASALKAGGATIGAMPCNTAHHWFDEIVSNSGLPFIHIADAVIADIRVRGLGDAAIGLLATAGTVHSGFYQNKLAESGLRPLVPDAASQQRVMRGIGCVKGGNPDLARTEFIEAAAALTGNGARAVILGCTEIPAVLEPSNEFIDSTLALAQACVSHFQGSALQSETYA